jgi:DNA-binding transcriptional ArsR family regulator
VFGALAHRSRRTIIGVLHWRGGEMTSKAIAERFDHSWPTTTRHLRVLEDAGLVTITLRGRERVYHLNRERLDGVAGGWIDRYRVGLPLCISQLSSALSSAPRSTS